MAEEAPYSFEYISPGLLRGAHGDDFLLRYRESGKTVDFLGRMPRGEWPGRLDFPTPEEWPHLVSEWARDRRSEIEARVLEYAATRPMLRPWLDREHFGVVPPTHRPPPKAEIEKSVRMLDGAIANYEATLRRKWFELEFTASLLLVASALSFVAACIGYALDSIAGPLVGGFFCVVFFIASNRMEQHQRKSGAGASASHDDARASEMLATGEALSVWRELLARRPGSLSKTPSLLSYSWYWFAGVALALLTPESLVAQSSFIQATLQTMGEWIPAMHRYARFSAFPELMRFWIAAMWLLMPIFVVYHLLTPWGPQLTLTVQTMTLKQFLIVFAFVPAACFLTLTLSFWFYENPVPEQYSYTGGRTGAMTAWALNSKFGLAILGSTVFWVQSVWFGAGLRTIWRTFTASCRKYLAR